MIQAILAVGPCAARSGCGESARLFAANNETTTTRNPDPRSNADTRSDRGQRGRCRPRRPAYDSVRCVWPGRSPVAAPLRYSLRELVPSEARSEHSRVSCNDSSAARTGAMQGGTMDAGRRTMSALKTSEGGKSSRPDECSTHCGAQCGALLYPFDRSSASTDDSAARTNATPGRTKDARPCIAPERAAESSVDAELRSKG